MPVRKPLSGACAVAAATLLILGAPQASQAAASSASISDILFQVTDLTPDDGQRAGYFMANQKSFVIGDAGGFWSGSDPSVSFDESSPHWLAALSDTRGFGTGVVGASTGSFGLFAYGQTSDMSSDYATTATTMAGITTSGRQGVFVAPHTEVAISADYHLFAALDALDCTAGCQQAGAEALLEVGSALQDVRLSLDGQTSASAGPAYKDGLFTFTITNNSDQWISDLVSFDVAANGMVSPTVPVPEPESYALLGAGLAVVSLVARRKQRQGRGA